MASTAAAPPPASRRQMSHATGSQTQTETRVVPILNTRQPVLHLRGAAVPRRNEPRVQWASDVVDNEGMGKKSSKVCCIYHAPKPIDESSDESSSDDSSSDESGNDDGSARPVGGRRRGHAHHHDHSHHNSNNGKGKGRARSPNAYEKMPKAKAPSASKESQ